jgi:hypothetical protein
LFEALSDHNFSWSSDSQSWFWMGILLFHYNKHFYLLSCTSLLVTMFSREHSFFYSKSISVVRANLFLDLYVSVLCLIQNEGTKKYEISCMGEGERQCVGVRVHVWMRLCVWMGKWECG